jgi:hypothetical protein
LNLAENQGPGVRTLFLTPGPWFMYFMYISYISVVRLLFFSKKMPIDIYLAIYYTVT